MLTIGKHKKLTGLPPLLLIKLILKKRSSIQIEKKDYFFGQMSNLCMYQAQPFRNFKVSFLSVLRFLIDIKHVTFQ